MVDFTFITVLVCLFVCFNFPNICVFLTFSSYFLPLSFVSRFCLHSLLLSISSSLYIRCLSSPGYLQSSAKYLQFPTHNPLVWCLVAVFSIIPNQFLIILRHPPTIPQVPSVSSPHHLSTLFPPTSPQPFMAGVKSN